MLLRETIDGFTIYRFDSLVTEGLTHAVFSRLGGVSVGPLAELNVGHSVGDDAAAVAENHARIYHHLGLSADLVTSAQQVHGNRVAVVNAIDAGRVFPNTDALVTRTPALPLMLRFADCQPILFYDPTRHALGLAHAGWRGVALGIARRVVETMQGAFGTRPEVLKVGLGPAVGPCCYHVGQDVASAMSYALPDWRKVMRPQGEGWVLDLPAANAQQLDAAGVQHIERADLCTACHTSEFFSHRAENGLTGRFAVVAYLERKILEPEAGENTALPEDHSAQDPTPVLTLSPPGFPPFHESLGGSH